MSPKKDLRRHSILKKRRSVEEDTTEFTISKVQKKTHFSHKNQVKEFAECSERNTIWGSTYETSTAKSEGSSCSSDQSSASISQSKSSISIQQSILTSVHSIHDQSEKENIIIHTQSTSTTSEQVEQQQQTRHSNDRSSVEFTIFVDPSEKQRMQKYGVDNLNITSNMDASAASSLLNRISNENAKVLSPRKMIFNNKSNISVTIQDKVHSKASQEDNVSFSLEQDEAFGSSKYFSTSSAKPSTSKAVEPKAVIFTTPKALKPNSQMFDSPMRSTQATDTKSEIEEIFKIIVSDTPSKNLCCLGKLCTPTRSDNKVIFTSQRPDLTERKSINLFEEFHNIEEDKVKQSARKTVFHNDTINIDKKENEHASIFKPPVPKVVLNTPHQQTRRTINFNEPMRLENEQDEYQQSIDTRKSMVNARDMEMDDLVTGEINSGMIKRPINQSRKSVIVNETMNIEDSMVNQELERTNQPRKTVFLNESIPFDKGTERKTILQPVEMQVSDEKTSRRTIAINESMQLETEHDASLRYQQSVDTRKSYNMSAMRRDLEMDEKITGEIHSGLIKRQPRKSIFVNETMNIEDTAENNFIKSSNQAPRRTALLNESIQLNESKTIHHPVEMQSTNERVSRNTRKTMVLNDSMQIETVTLGEPIQCDRGTERKTVEMKNYGPRRTMVMNDSMKLENMSGTSKSFNTRKSMVNARDMEMEENKPTHSRMIQRQPRKSIFVNETMNIEDSIVNQELERTQSHAPRKTVFLNESIPFDKENERRSILKPSVPKVVLNTPHQQTRHTINFNDSMRLENEQDEYQQSVDTRKSIADARNMEMDDLVTGEINSGMIKRLLCQPRKSVIANETMNIEDSMINQELERTSQPRKTVFLNESIPFDKGNERKTIYQPVEMQTETESDPRITRKTMLVNDSMKIENMPGTSKNFDMRKSMVNARDMEMEENEPTHSGMIRRLLNQPRKSIFVNETMNIEDSMVNQELKRTQSHVPRKTVFLNESIPFDKENERKTILQSTEMQVSDEKPPRKTMVMNYSMQLDNEEIKNQMPSKIHRQTINQTVCIDTDDDPRRTVNLTTGCVSEETNQSRKSIATSMGDGEEDFTASILREAALLTQHTQFNLPTEIDRRKTLSKDESMRWHNITDKDFMLNMIDDESNPCLSSLDHIEQPLKRVSSAMEVYENAVEDFVNLTIVDSPLHNSMRNQSIQSRATRRQSRIPSPIKNYDNMFDDFANNLRKKDQPLPRLEIDEYLEQLQVRREKIPRYPVNDSTYFNDKLRDISAQHTEHCEKMSKFKTDYAAVQFPEIPSAVFLMRNYIECMEEEIMKEIVNEPDSIAPVFPASKDLELLLNNKFETDDHLKQYWCFDPIYWWKRNFKLTHWEMPLYTIVFNFKQKPDEINDSTIHILFKNVLLYETGEFQKKANTTTRNLLLRNEFKKAIHMTSNFTSMCSSFRDLFSFLDYYHEHVMRTVQLLDNFYKILLKYGAVYSQNGVIQKMCFFEDELEIVEIKITMEGHIEELSVNDLKIIGKCYSYSLQPRACFNEMKGLMFLEFILYDSEKFLNEYTIKERITN